MPLLTELEPSVGLEAINMPPRWGLAGLDASLFGDPSHLNFLA